MLMTVYQIQLHNHVKLFIKWALEAESVITESRRPGDDIEKYEKRRNRYTCTEIVENGHYNFVY